MMSAKSCRSYPCRTHQRRSRRHRKKIRLIGRKRRKGHPEQATMSAFVAITESKRAREPNSPVRSELGNPLRQMTTLHKCWPFQYLSDMNRLAPSSSNSRAKHCGEEMCSAISLKTQLERCWKIT